MVAVFMIVMGLGIILIWSADILRGAFRDQGRLTDWRNEGGDLMWPHLLAEYLTGFALIAGGIGLWIPYPGSLPLAYASLGALFYTSLNSHAWVLADRSRLMYGVPMGIGLIGSIVSAILLMG